MRRDFQAKLLLSATILAGGDLPAFADVTISNASTQNINCGAGVCAPTAAAAVLNVKDLEGFLASGNVEVSTTGTGVQAINIRVAANLSWTGATSLALDAYKSITINKSMNVKGTGGFSAITNDGGTGGEFSFGAGGNLTFANLSSPLTMNGTAYTLESSVAALAAAIAANPSGAYALADSYDASQDGTYGAPPIPTVFTGAFNGLGNTISNLTINDPTPNSAVGLFAQSMVAIFANIRLTNASVSGGSGSQQDDAEYVGGLVGGGFGATISHSFVSGALSGGDYAAVGGLAGVEVDGSIVASGSSATIFTGSQGAAGGVAGLTDIAAVTSSFGTGNVSGSTYSDVGGLVGSTYEQEIKNSHATGVVTATGDGVYAGGLVGMNYAGIVATSFATGAVECQGQDGCGGLVGFQASDVGPAPAIRRSLATGNVTSSGGAGGLVGLALAGTISDSYASGDASAPLAGGLIGQNDNISGYHSVERSYSTGVVTGSAGQSGGLIGYDEFSSTIKHAYWDTTTSGITDKGQGAGNVENDPGIKGLSTVKLQSGLPKGFSPKVWAETPDINGGLPYLIDNPPPK